MENIFRAFSCVHYPLYTNAHSPRIEAATASAASRDAGHADEPRFKRISSRTVDFENSGGYSLSLAVNLVTLEHGSGESLEGFVLRQL